MLRFFLAGLATVAGVVLVFFMSFGDVAGTWQNLEQRLTIPLASPLQRDAQAEPQQVARAIPVPQPPTTQSQAAQPQAEQPQTAQLQTAQPQTLQPESAQPQSVQSQSTQAQSEQPKTAQLQTLQPESAQARSTRPQSTQEQSAQPQTSQWQTAQSHTAQQESKPQQTAQPDSMQPQFAQSEVQKLQARLEAATQSMAALQGEAEQQRQQLALLQQQHSADQAQLRELKQQHAAAAAAAAQDKAQQDAAAVALRQAKAAQSAAEQAAQRAQQQQQANALQAKALPDRTPQSAQDSPQAVPLPAPEPPRDSVASSPPAGANAEPKPAGPDQPPPAVAERAARNSHADRQAAAEPHEDRQAAAESHADQAVRPAQSAASATPRLPEHASQESAAEHQRPQRRSASVTDPDSLRAVLQRLHRENAQSPATRSAPPPAPGPAAEARRDSPPVTPSRERLGRARAAILQGRLQQAQQLLEEAQLQLVFRPASPDGATAPGDNRATADVAEALSMLGAGRGDLAVHYIDRAMAESGASPQQASLPPPRTWQPYGGPESQPAPGRFPQY